MAFKPNKSAMWFGKYLSLALTLPASVMGGYILGSIGGRFLHVPLLRGLGILLGLVAGLWQIFRELIRDDQKKGPPG